MSYIFTASSLKKLKFLPGFDSSKVTDMSDFFSRGIEEIDLNYLKTDNVISMRAMFWSSNSLISIDLSKFNTSKLKDMRDMFSQNFYLKYVDLTSFETSNITLCQSLFYENIVNIEIKISNKFKNCLQYIPKTAKIVNIDELACQNIEYCQKCAGSKENLLCAACKLGYYLEGNKCIIPNCIIGENEKCHNCSFMTENECLTCNIGYYLPKNNSDKSKCTKCETERCEICNDISGNCEKCQKFYKPFFDEETSKIIFCKKLCEYGDGNKCASCDEKQDNKCLSCNPGYKLMKNGTCVRIDNTFIAIYNVTSTSKFVRIIRNLDSIFNSLLTLNDLDIFIDGNKISLSKCNYGINDCYKFQKTGFIEIKITIKKTLTNLARFFEKCNQLVNVKFNEAFDTSDVLSVTSMFWDCTSLKSVDFSSFNTSLICKMHFMFQNCYELTSIDLSNFDTRNVINFQDMFRDNYKLNYIDISSFNTINSENSWLFYGVSGNGTIIINKETYTGDIPEGFNVVYKN